jgi:DNA-binding response OmpR family regulator
MLRIVLVTPRPEALEKFAAALSAHAGVRLEQVTSGSGALAAVSLAAPHLVIIDAKLPDMEPLELVQKLLTVNALVNTAVVSPLAEAEFHEASEGLGVLSHLPLDPGEKEAADLMGKVRLVLGEQP